MNLMGHCDRKYGQWSRKGNLGSIMKLLGMNVLEESTRIFWYLLNHEIDSST